MSTGKKISQFDSLTTALTSAYVTVVQAGKNYVITVANFLKSYYTKTEIDAIVANIEAGGVAWNKKVLDDLSILANTEKSFTHDLGTEDFLYDFLVWNSGKGTYLKESIQPAESGRTSTTISFYSMEAIPKFKLILFG